MSPSWSATWGTDGAAETIEGHADQIDIPDHFDQPKAIAAQIAALEPPILLVCDCDGVLAPLVDHADDSRLLDGVGDVLRQLASAPAGSARSGAGYSNLSVAVLSGRSLDGLTQFDFSPDIIVVGSYGGERRDGTPTPLDDSERNRLEALVTAAHQACRIAGDGAWVEHKPASVVLHVRTADQTAGKQALESLATAQSAIDGSTAHHGSNVLELMARPTDKGAALQRLRSDEQASAVVYLGDDIPDEDAFAVLGAGDLSIKVGRGNTQAQRRLANPDAIRELLEHLAALRS